MFINITKRAILHLDTEVKLFCLYILLMVYMLCGTGIVSDDFAFLVNEREFGSIFESIVSGNNLYFERPLFKYLYSTYYSVMDLKRLDLIDFLKILQIVIIFYGVTKFFSLFLDITSSMMVSFLFIFFPTHDSTTYWYLEISLTLTIGLYLFAYYLLQFNRMISAGIISITSKS